MMGISRARIRRTVRRDLGVSLIGYALVLSLFVVGSIPAIDYITEESADEAANQSSCVSQRPPPVACLRRAGDPSYTPPAADAPDEGAVDGDIVIDDAVDDLPDDGGPLVPNAELTIAVSTRLLGDSGKWQVRLELDVTLLAPDGDEATLEGVELFASARNVRGFITVIKTSSCTTDGSGACTLDTSWSTIFTPTVEITFVDIYSSSGLVFALPDPILVDKPRV